MEKSQQIKLDSHITHRNGNGYNKPFAIPHEKKGIKIFSQPLISLIIPVLDEEKILENTLKIYTKEIRRKYNFELIVSDGGSKDNSVEIAGKYADCVVVHRENRRQSIAEGRNKGAEKANGDILVFINADTVPVNLDYFLEYISSWTEISNKYHESSALACKVTVAPEEKNWKDSVFYTLHNFYVRMLNAFGVGMGRGECQIVKSEIFKQVKGYNSKIIAGEDFDFYRRIAKIGKISFVPFLMVYESPRRFRKFGYIPILFSWTLNSLSVMFYNRSVSKEWEAVR